LLDLLIKNARIIDGSGTLSYVGSIGIRSGRIVTVTGNEEAAQIIDANGHCLAPGFIDAHSHGDMLLGTKDTTLFKTTQGVTSEMAGQCGLSMAPVSPETIKDIQNMLSMGTASFPDDMVNWQSFARYLTYADAQPKTLNTKMYVGHSSLRIAVMGMANRPATEKELDKMKGILRESMEAGAAGFSTGLIYTPSCYAEEREIVELAKVIAPFGGIYASHMRNEGTYLIESVRETIDIGRKAGVPVDISHHKAVGQSNYGKQKETLRLIDDANRSGMTVFCDQYPYTRNMTTLNACMPPWHLSDGFDRMTQKLKDPAFRRRLRAEMEDPSTNYDNYYLNAGGWDGVYVYSAPLTPKAEGHFISEYAALLEQDPWDTFFDICVENHCTTGGVYSSMCDEDLCDIIRSPYCIIGSDGLTRSWHEKGHPRASATFPHALCYFVKQKGILTLEQAVRKMTGLTAEYLGFSHKGFIKEGCDADLVLFDYDHLQDTATYDHPNSLTEGIDLVMVAGEIVYQNKQLTGLMPGKILRHNTAR